MQEFQTLYQENHDYIYRFVYESVKNHEDAEDLTGDIFLKAVRWVTYERGPKRTQFWLVQVARTTIADYWRARSRLAISSLDALLEDGWEEPGSAKARSSDPLLDRAVLQKSTVGCERREGSQCIQFRQRLQTGVR